MLASRWLRLAAAILHSVIIIAVAMISAAVLGVFNQFQPAPSYGQVLLMNIIGLAAYVVINWHFLSRRGQTVGKRICGIKIVKKDGSSISAGAIILKRYFPIWVIMNILVIGAVIGLVDSLLIFRKSRYCLHDDIAGTKVIEVAA